jgi:hypothetical protein
MVRRERWALEFKENIRAGETRARKEMRTIWQFSFICSWESNKPIIQRGHPIPTNDSNTVTKGINNFHLNLSKPNTSMGISPVTFLEIAKG